MEELEPHGCGTNCTNVIAWITKQLEAIHDVDVYQHQYREHLYDQEYVTRTNIYAILKAAPLADGKESIVLVAHYPNIPTTNKNGFSGMSVGIAMLRHLADIKWLSKDIILLIADGTYRKIFYLCLYTFIPAVDPFIFMNFQNDLIFSLHRWS